MWKLWSWCNWKQGPHPVATNPCVLVSYPRGGAPARDNGRTAGTWLTDPKGSQHECWHQDPHPRPWLPWSTNWLTHALTQSLTQFVTLLESRPVDVEGGQIISIFCTFGRKTFSTSARHAQCNEEVSIVVPLLGTRICESHMDLECGLLNIRTMCTAVSTFPHTCTAILFIREPSRARQDRLLCLSYTRCIW